MSSRKHFFEPSSFLLTPRVSPEVKKKVWKKEFAHLVDFLLLRHKVFSKMKQTLEIWFNSDQSEGCNHSIWNTAKEFQQKLVEKQY